MFGSRIRVAAWFMMIEAGHRFKKKQTKTAGLRESTYLQVRYVLLKLGAWVREGASGDEQREGDYRVGKRRGE